jgi:ADP-ribosylglycohydrolase
MRILPVAIYLAFAEQTERMQVAMTCSRLTHGHPRSQLACALYVEVAAALVRRTPISEAFAAAQQAIRPIIARQFAVEHAKFARLLSSQLLTLADTGLSGSGYVIQCLESSLWCASRAASYADGVLAAVNLGDDTDTTGAVTGGLLGLRFGKEAIPQPWVAQLARREAIVALCDRFQGACDKRWEADQ